MKKGESRVEKSMPRIPAPPKPARRFNPPPPPIARIANPTAPNAAASNQNDKPIKNIHEPVVKRMKQK